MNVHEIITDRIVKEIEKGTAPWQRSWSCGDVPANLISKREYSGVNLFLAFMPYESRWWLTMKQANKIGAKIRKGESPTYVVFWQVREDKDDADRKRFLLRYYKVWNVEQCDGIPAKLIPEKDDSAPVVINAAEEIVASVERWQPSAPTVKRTANAQPRYSPKSDTVHLPLAKQFKSAEANYKTTFHELVHASGTKDRLNRKGIVEFDRFGSDQYAFEELVAELGAAFLCGRTGIANDAVIANSAAYLEHWAKVLRENPRWIVFAGSQAGKAADYILTGKLNGHDEPKTESEEVSE